MQNTDCLLVLSFLFVSIGLLILSILPLTLVYYPIGNYFTYAQVKQPELKDLRLNDPELATELVFKGIKAISNMAFLGPDDILFLERLEGKVMRIVHGTLLPESLLDVEVANNDGLLGIAIAKNANRPTYVFLYYTESKTDGGERLGNRLYRYELQDNLLVNPKLLLDLPINPGPMHHGGELIIGPDNNLYVAVGDIDGWRNETTRTVVQNYDAGIRPDGRAGILRVTQDGEIAGEGILGNGHPLDMYYAYGLRNSFGLDFDPVTGILWDTENGPDFGDEINLVEPGFNSGSDIIRGKSIDKYQSQELVDFEKKGKYSDPEFSWGTE
jgi:glucose/arabinose dehydrogenase